MKKILLYAVLLSLTVSAVPLLPEAYLGKAYINGNIAPDGTNIKLISSSGESWDTTVVTNGDWSLDILFDDPDTPIDEGASKNDALTWYINDEVTNQPTAGEDIATSGGNNINFIISLGSPPEPTCSDEIKNQGEVEVDCGGPCPACAKPTTTVGSDKGTTTVSQTNETTTTSKSFVSNILSKFKSDSPTTTTLEATREPSGFSCYDGVKNQAEESVDCGGPCKPCRSFPFPWWLAIVLFLLMVIIAVVLVIGIVIYLKKR